MSVSVNKSELSRKLLTGISGFKEKTKNNITGADILIVPRMVEREGQVVRTFPEGTSDFVKLATRELNEYNVRLCENEGDEKSYVQHFADIVIPVLLIAETAILPIVLNFVANYIYHKFLEGRRSDGSSERVNLEIIVEERSKKLSYQGDVAGLEKIASHAMQLLERDNDSDDL